MGGPLLNPLAGKKFTPSPRLCLTTCVLQWREASYTRSGGDVVRVYTVCNVAVTSVDNWLRTPFIASRQAHRLYIRIHFSMRKCTKYPNPGRLQQCKVSIPSHLGLHTAAWIGPAQSKK